MAVRAFGLGTTTLSRDEAFSWRLTEYPTTELVRRVAADDHPPLHYLLLQAWAALWGSSPIALRSLSVLCGALCVPMVYAACVEARGRWCRKAASAGALLAALLMAVHLSQVTPGRVGRMYSLGTLLAGLTAWLLWKALHGRQNRALWWSAYGVAVTAFCATHYYAFFSVFAQAVFVAGALLVCARRTSVRQAAVAGAGFLFAGAIALLLYSPWLPVLHFQVQEVRQAFWIPEVTAPAAERALLSWGTGLPYPGALEGYLWLALLAFGAGYTLWHGDRAGWFFLLQAAVPWLLSLGISVYSGRSLFLEKYLVFAHFFLIGFWGVFWSALPGWPERLLLAGFLGLTCLSGTWAALTRLPNSPPALAAAAEFLKGHYESGDVILVDGPGQLNQLRYYATQAGAGSLDVRCRMSLSPRGGHVSHVASLRSEEVLWTDEPTGPHAHGRVWRASEQSGAAQEPPKGRRPVLTRTFEGGGNTRSTLVLYDCDG